MKTCRTLSLLLAGSLAWSAACPAQTPIRICPVGDSILQSYGGAYSARYYLDQMLAGGTYAFDFVGHNYGVFGGQPADPNFDQDHEAYGGWQVNHMLLELQQWTFETQPDIVLFHMGTNDIIAAQSASSTVNEIAQCIDMLRGVNPNITVLISQIIPMSTRAVEPLNSLIPGMVATKDSPESRIVTVDHYTGFDLGTMIGPDGVHPNDLGEQFMAQAWYSALKDFLTPGADEFTNFGSGCGTVDSPSIEWIRGQAASLGNPFSVKIEHLTPAGLPFAFLGFSQTDFNGVPLPIDLTALGAPGCSLFVGPDLTIPLTNSGGGSIWTLPIPNNPVLVGGKIYQQVIVIDPPSNPLGMIVSDASSVTIVEG